MKNNRRNFLKLTSLAGLSVAGGSFLKELVAGQETLNKSNYNSLQKTVKRHTQQFNM